MILATLIAGCSATGGPMTADPADPMPAPGAVEAPLAAPAAPNPIEVPAPAPAREPSLAPPSPSPGPLARLLPAGLADRDGWAAEISIAFAALRVPPTTEDFCAAIAVIEQESSFHADPVVPGLSRIARKEIERRRRRLGIPRLLLDAAFARRSRDGRSYAARIDRLRTEREMSEIFEEMIADLPYGGRLFSRYNPVRTGGPMQVSVDFAEAQVRAAPYPFPPLHSVRHEVFSRRGGLYFGIAHLLAYPAPYEQPLYRFADYNGGRYSARNAAFQSAVMAITKRRLSLDGDLLRYTAEGVPAASASDTQHALDVVAGRLRMDRNEIRRDLFLEKTPSFQETALYRRVFALADLAHGGRQPRALLPQIDLKSPKIHRHLTTAWFARRVNERYLRCLAAERSGPLADASR